MHTHTHTLTPCILHGVLVELSVPAYELVPELPWHELEGGTEGRKGRGGGRVEGGRKVACSARVWYHATPVHPECVITGY